MLKDDPIGISLTGPLVFRNICGRQETVFAMYFEPFIYVYCEMSPCYSFEVLCVFMCNNLLNLTSFTQIDAIVFKLPVFSCTVPYL
jgi:hypothetical protein